jgi:asparagine synthase (glutamine-hydrolysing)
MCGIFGVVRLDGQCAEDSRGLVTAGVDLLKHRGPDAWGVDAHGPVCLGHSRLSIIDLAGGAQPMRSEDGQGLITYNGEIYNFVELRHELSQKGRLFRTKSDTEVLLNAYLEWGPECVERIRGMFAFVAVDYAKNTVLIARDRLGIKPLFYVLQNNRLIFSSELEAIYRSAGPFQMDLNALDDYLEWQYIHAPDTIYKEVRQLPPAHLVTVDLATGKITEKRYWELVFREDRSLTIQEWTDQLDDVIREAVRIRLVSDVPFGAFLSGGIDSSLVVGYMAEIMDQPVQTFSIGFKEGDYSELQYAAQVSQINRTQHHTKIVEADSLGLLPLLVRHYGQPFADSSAIPTYYVSQMAREHVTMVLSGDGGDENFAGYNSYESVFYALFPDWSGGTGPLKARAKRILKYFYRKLQTMRHRQDMLDSAYEAHCNTARHFNPRERRELFKEPYKCLVRDASPSRRKKLDIGRQPLISRLQNLDLTCYLPYDILTKVDIASMANSLEVRVPLLDHILVETAATIPAEFKFREERLGKTIQYDKKHLLKRLARQRYPAEVIDRPKMGFGVPLNEWFAGKLKEDVQRRLLKSECLPILFNTESIRDILNRHFKHQDQSTKIWNLLFLDEWMRTHGGALSGL